jgi:hypothetical protein
LSVRAGMLRNQFGAGDFGFADAQPKHGGGKMLRSVDGAIDIQDFLRARDVEIVGKAVAEVRESGAGGRARGGGEPCAPGAAVEVEAKGGAPSAQGGELYGQDVINIGIVLEEGAEAGFDDYGHAQIGAGAFEQLDCGRGEDAIPQRPQPYDGHSAAGRQLVYDVRHRLVFDLRLIHQHYGNIVAHRIDAMALDAL